MVCATRIDFHQEPQKRTAHYQGCYITDLWIFLTPSIEIEEDRDRPILDPLMECINSKVVTLRIFGSFWPRRLRLTWIAIVQSYIHLLSVTTLVTNEPSQGSGSARLGDPKPKARL